MILEQIVVLKTQKAKVIRTITDLETTLKNNLTGEDFDTVQRVTNLARQREFLKKRDMQKKKFDRLLAEKAPTQLDKIVIKNAVLNISGKQLREGEMSVMEKGLGFVPAPNMVPTKEIICAAEVGLKKIKDPIEANVARSKIASILRSSKPPKDNLTKEERFGLKSLQVRNDIKILPADKGNTVVVLSAGQYSEKLKDLLADRAYKKMARDPTRTKERKMRDLINRIKVKGENQLREQVG